MSEVRKRERHHLPVCKGRPNPVTARVCDGGLLFDNHLPNMIAFRMFGDQAPFDVAPSYQFLPTYTSASDSATFAPLGQELAAFELGLPSVSMMTRSASYASQDVYSSHQTYL